MAFLETFQRWLQLLRLLIDIINVSLIFLAVYQRYTRRAGQIAAAAPAPAAVEPPAPDPKHHNPFYHDLCTNGTRLDAVELQHFLLAGIAAGYDECKRLHPPPVHPDSLPSYDASHVQLYMEGIRKLPWGSPERGKVELLKLFTEHTPEIVAAEFGGMTMAFSQGFGEGWKLWGHSTEWDVGEKSEMGEKRGGIAYETN